jgi:hypothetical protein
MAFLLSEFCAEFPYVYHLTAQGNIRRIARTRCLESTAALLSRAGRPNLLRDHRDGPTPIPLDGETVVLRDQDPLQKGHIEFHGGWGLADLVEHLNRRVFFWPGTEHGESDYGRRHLGRYFHEEPAIIRIRLADLLAANTGNPPLFSSCNSGSPRTVNKKKAPRGPDTFLPHDSFPGRPRSVVEVTLVGSVHLPASTEVRSLTFTPWGTLPGTAPAMPAPPEPSTGTHSPTPPT